MPSRFEKRGGYLAFSKISARAGMAQQANSSRGRPNRKMLASKKADTVGFCFSSQLGCTAVPGGNCSAKVAR